MDYLGYITTHKTASPSCPSSLSCSTLHWESGAKADFAQRRPLTALEPTGQCTHIHFSGLWQGLTQNSTQSGKGVNSWFGKTFSWICNYIERIGNCSREEYIPANMWVPWMRRHQSPWTMDLSNLEPPWSIPVLEYVPISMRLEIYTWCNCSNCIEIHISLILPYLLTLHIPLTRGKPWDSGESCTPWLSIGRLTKLNSVLKTLISKSCREQINIFTFNSTFPEEIFSYTTHTFFLRIIISILGNQ